MEFTCAREELSKGIQAVQRVVANRGPLPILSNVLIATDGDRLRITATDLEVGIEATVPATVKASGAVTIAARQLAEIINKLPNSDVALSVGDSGSRATVQCERSRFVLPGLPSDEFPKLPQLAPNATSLKLASAELLKGIRQTGFAAAKDDKSVISGIFLQVKDGHLEVVATDGYRLAWRRWAVEAEGNLAVIVPARAMSELARLLGSSEDESLVVANAQNQILFTLGDRFMTSRLIDGTFPNYGQIIPASFSCQVLVDRALLQSAVERVSIMASEREAKVVKLTFTDGDLHLQANAIDLGEGDEHLPIEYVGETMTIAFNATYLLDALKALEGETATIKLNGSLLPALVQSVDDETYSCLLMPIRS